MTEDAPRLSGTHLDTALLPVLWAVAEQSPIGLVVFDPQMRYLLVNSQMAEMANTPAAQMIGRPVRAAFPEYEALTTRVEHVLATGEPLIGLDVVGRVPGEDRDHTWSLSAYRLVGEDGQVLGVAVTSSEVTALRELEHERAALATRLEILAAAGDLMSRGLDEPATVAGVLDLVVPAVADWACLHLLEVEDSGEGHAGQQTEIWLAGAKHSDPGAEPHLLKVLCAFPVTTVQAYGAGHVIATGTPEEMPEVTDEVLIELADGDEEALAGLRALDVSHGLVVPLAARGNTFGALSLSVPTAARHPEAPPGPVMEGLLDLVADVASRAALALDNARLFSQQRDLAVTLQRSLLPQTLPAPDGWDLAARYLPGAAGTEIGGDFYEAVMRRDDRLTFAIGDVAGRGMQAAAIMGQVRAALRGYALEHQNPAAVLRRLNAMVTALEGTALVTCLVGSVTLATGTVVFASAGHLPPVLLRADGSCRPVPVDPGPPLGAPWGRFAPARTRVLAGETLLLFTDGLVESREQALDEGIGVLCRTLGATPTEALGTAADTCQSALTGMGRSMPTTDDVALLALRRTH